MSVQGDSARSDLKRACRKKELRFSRSSCKILNATPGALGAPDAGSERLKLHDLAVIDKQVDLVAVVLDVPFEHRGIGAFEHHLCEAELVDNAGSDVGAPSLPYGSSRVF